MGRIVDASMGFSPTGFAGQGVIENVSKTAAMTHAWPPAEVRAVMVPPADSSAMGLHAAVRQGIGGTRTRSVLQWRTENLYRTLN